MGRIFGGVTGTVKRKVANVVFYAKGGRNYVRAKASSYKDKNSTAQQNYRSRMSQIVALSRLIIGAIRSSFSNRLKHLSGFNAFTKANLNDLVFGVGTAVMDFSAVIISKGVKLIASGVSATLTALSTTLVVTWLDNSNGTTGLSTDLAQLVVYNETTNEAVTVDTIATRSSGTATIATMPDTWITGNVIHLWVYFRSADGALKFETSDSSYFTMNVI